jgi:hypothetical protein
MLFQQQFFPNQMEDVLQKFFHLGFVQPERGKRDEERNRL